MTKFSLFHSEFSDWMQSPVPSSCANQVVQSEASTFDDCFSL